MSDNVKNGTSLFRLYELVVLQKIQSGKPKKKQPEQSFTCQPEIICDGFGQMIYNDTVKPDRK
ncbi:hypothetical protein [Desulforamulus hydrothermalis]|uniref:Uncharacterized protein n=1 Tax=Desulforamulus hydrothermalis Lam5 = DSM 18033 TaxID=1121428 RepID=K8ECA6_9FIRM|nr:hypothetical protein [Desulforamulus hydrothermalis]CCO09318.1 conserved hypothetical protein [Desulforamulus hydrothermalis Lam5 = DSM 18033]SHH04253.1 hypothetical protein SAMN02745177_01219 [Desulforamulus hydrothermalis Lam5 = DSM 18033]